VHVAFSSFVALYNRDGVDAIGLDDAARRLGVERRRIYDIVNVLESVGVRSCFFFLIPTLQPSTSPLSWVSFLLSVCKYPQTPKTIPPNKKTILLRCVKLQIRGVYM
jgi:E2F/DP family winged-helix DNA-binding domain